MEKTIVDNLCLLAIKAAILAGNEIMDVYENNNFEIEYKSDNSPLTIADKKAHEKISKTLEKTNIQILSEEGANIPYHVRKKWEIFWLIDPLDGTKEFIKRNGEFTVNIALIEYGKPIMGVIYAPVLGQIYFGQNQQAFMYRVKMENNDINEIVSEINQRKIKLPLETKHQNYIAVASRSHLSEQTKQFIQELEQKHGHTELVSVGSSLKFCLIAEGKADIYPRFGPTMEWDTAAGHAIVNAVGGTVSQISEIKELEYNKADLLNPWFIVKK